MQLKRFKPTYFKYNILRSVIKQCKLKCSLQKQNNIYAINITACITALRDIFKGQEKPTFEHRYFAEPLKPDLIQQADDLYIKKKYIEVYELLNKLRTAKKEFCSNAEVLWRVSRALFAMSYNESLTRLIREEMINEAYELIRIALANQNNNADVHKWMAILLDSTAGHVSTYSRIKAMAEVKQHLLRAIELNPNDAETLYMLGHWCYQLANLTWFQRKLASILFTSPPLSSYEEAYNYLLQAEQLNPRFFIGNTFMLGRVCIHMKQCYRAKYYLDIAASLPCKNDHEKQYRNEAKKLSSELHHYDLSKNVLFDRG